MPPYSVPGTVSASANLTVTLTGTWTPDTNSDNTPPPGVLFAEIFSAQGIFSNGDSLTQAGQANDGFGDPQVPFGSLIGTSSTNGTKYVPSSGGSITATLTLSASATGTQPAHVGGGGASASVGPASISIHAQPYNFRSTSFTDANGVFHPAVVIDNPDAILALSYRWSSTDGVLADLTTCTFDEKITWDTNTVGSVKTVNGTSAYVPPSPPAGTNAQGRPIAYSDPVILGGPAANSGSTDTFSPDTAYTGPYTVISWWGDQTYVFSDTATKEVNTPIPGPAP